MDVCWCMWSQSFNLIHFRLNAPIEWAFFLFHYLTRMSLHLKYFLFAQTLANSLIHMLQLMKTKIRKKKNKKEICFIFVTFEIDMLHFYRIRTLNVSSHLVASLFSNNFFHSKKTSSSTFYILWDHSSVFLSLVFYFICRCDKNKNENDVSVSMLRNIFVSILLLYCDIYLYFFHLTSTAVVCSCGRFGKRKFCADKPTFRWQS